MLVLGRILFGYAITAFGAYLMVIDVHPFAAAPFFTGTAVLMVGTGIAHPAQAIPMLGYCVSAISKLAFWRPKEETPEHKHRRRSDPGEPHKHHRHTPTSKRLSVGEFTISQPMVPEDDVRAHHHRQHKRSDD